MTEASLRDRIAEFAVSLFNRGLTSGSTGNISVKLDDGWLMTPTGSSMGFLDPSKISKLDVDGNHVDGDKPTKEAFMHMCMYDQRPKARAVVHLHSPYAVAVSCLDGLNSKDVMPAITPYYVMRIGALPLVPYFAPGDPTLGHALSEQAKDNHAILLANHGPVVAGSSLENAIYATEELEEAAKLYFILAGHQTRPLSDAAIAELHQRFPKDV